MTASRLTVTVELGQDFTRSTEVACASAGVADVRDAILTALRELLTAPVPDHVSIRVLWGELGTVGSVAGTATPAELQRAATALARLLTT